MNSEDVEVSEIMDVADELLICDQSESPVKEKLDAIQLLDSSI